MLVQLHLEILELDIGTNRDDLIDRFAVDIAIPFGSTSERQTYSGLFKLAEIELSFRVDCTEHFAGPNCDTFPTEDNQLTTRLEDQEERGTKSYTSSNGACDYCCNLGSSHHDSSWC